MGPRQPRQPYQKQKRRRPSKQQIGLYWEVRQLMGYDKAREWFPEVHEYLNRVRTTAAPGVDRGDRVGQEQPRQ